MRFRRIQDVWAFTLVEMVIAISIAGVVFAGVMQASAFLISQSANPILRQQSIYIAEMFLAEIQTKAFARANETSPPVTHCPTILGSGSRQDFSHVCHYHNFSQTGIEDQNETAVSGLELFSVVITVSESAALGPADSLISSDDAVLVRVTVTSPDSQIFTASFYRVDVMREAS